MNTVEYLNPPYKVTVRMLEWQRLGLQQTASGYGRKLTTPYLLDTGDGKQRRVYAICYSNVASHYVLIKGQMLFLRDSELEEARDAA